MTATGVGTVGRGENLDGAAAPLRATLNRSRRRGDIQGLRAVLMMQVLLYHAWGVGSPIGVDSFIMISAFLMTASFVRRAEAGAQPRIVERWASTFKRLLPSLTVVVIAILAGSFLLFTPDRWRSAVTQSFASLTYWENWWLADNSVDYYAFDHAESSPFQHLWSMSMQGQMFLLWPVLMAAAVLVARKLRWDLRLTVSAAFAVLSALSLIWLLFFSPDNASVYFDTRARIWEFAFGSAVAAAAPFIRFPGRVAKALGWLALSVLLVYCLVSIGAYPGPMALVPLAAVSVLLLQPRTNQTSGASAALSFAPLVWLGDISYSVYLIHWPVFVFYLSATGRERLGAVDGVVLIAVSIVLAWILTLLVDRPAQFAEGSAHPIRYRLVVVGLSLTAGFAAVGAADLYLQRTLAVAQQREEEAREESQEAYPGAGVLLEDLAAEAGVDPIPAPAVLDKQWASFPSSCTDTLLGELREELQEGCSFLDSGTNGTPLLVVVGDSHAEQLLIPPVAETAEELGVNAAAVLKGGCAFYDPGPDSGDWDECDTHNARLLEALENVAPNYVLTVSTQASADSAEETVRPGFEQAVRRLTENGITVVGVRDNLRSERDLYQCSDEVPVGSSFGGCLLSRSEYFATTNPAEALDDIPGYHNVDFTDAYCTSSVCPTIVGNVFVYLDNNHVTRDYSSTVSPLFLEYMAEIESSSR